MLSRCLDDQTVIHDAAYLRFKNLSEFKVCSIFDYSIMDRSGFLRIHQSIDFSLEVLPKLASWYVFSAFRRIWGIAGVRAIEARALIPGSARSPHINHDRNSKGSS